MGNPKASFYNITVGDELAFLRNLVNAGLSDSDVKDVLRNPMLAEMMVNVLHDGSRYRTPPWYVSPAGQIKKVKRFVKLNRAYFGSRKWFDEFNVIPPIPSMFEPRTATEVLMLVVYFPFSQDSGHDNLKYTFDAWWNFIGVPKGYDKATAWDIARSDSNIRLHQDVSRYSGIYWVAFDPGISFSGTILNRWQDENCIMDDLAGPEVLMAAALFPRLVYKWTQKNALIPCMPTIQLRRGDVWDCTPCIGVEWQPMAPTLLKRNVQNARYPVENLSLPTVRRLPRI
ncbi:MAG: hypothetical protein NTV39_01825 [Candidatus Saccharibacteria bacterium]|nr:hypothetical protein [Candidatus Saccharibacteria bacterium]